MSKTRRGVLRTTFCNSSSDYARSNAFQNFSFGTHRDDGNKKPLQNKKKIVHTRGQKQGIPVFFLPVFLAKKWPTLGAVQRGWKCSFFRFFFAVVASTPRIGGVRSFVAMAVDFVPLWHPDAIFFCPFSGKNRGRKKEKSKRKKGKKKVSRSRALESRFLRGTHSVFNH